jgi:hypothetical protein
MPLKVSLYIDGATTQTLSENEFIKVISDGISWWII